ncbi:Iron-sulfur cluster-binding protein [Enterobacteriaceae bacterium bta3-1]|nr:Iron-sulfur cluster-binding protein [Enterobacteriaceae bacterium bta3-1]
MERHGMMRARPHELQPGTLRVISVRMNYLPAHAFFAKTLKNPQLGYISRYALGRDYHKLLRNRLKRLGEMIQEYCEGIDINFRPFVDSAPILERPLAAKAGIGWVGKHSLILNQEAGSWFFLGELLIDLPLPVDKPLEEQCGRCVACMTTCPTGAIVEPYVVDARRCISYLTIELESAIPEEFRPLMGNRIYGCDDCQMICPWNRFSQLTNEDDFSPRQKLHTPELIELFQWDEPTFLKITEGSAIRRIGHLRWLRNISVALGNAPYESQIIPLLESRLGMSDVLDEHIVWAVKQQLEKRGENAIEIQTSQQKRLIRAVEKGLPRDA